MVTTQVVPVVLTPEAIEALPVEPLGQVEGVRHRVLWRDETSMSGVLTVDPGRNLGEHTHRRNHHHIWVIDGEPIVLGQRLRPGELRAHPGRRGPRHPGPRGRALHRPLHVPAPRDLTSGGPWADRSRRRERPCERETCTDRSSRPAHRETA